MLYYFMYYTELTHAEVYLSNCYLENSHYLFLIEEKNLYFHLQSVYSHV